MKKTNANVGSFIAKEMGLKVDVANPTTIKQINNLKVEYMNQVIHLNNCLVDAIEVGNTELVEALTGLLNKINAAPNYKSVLDAIYTWCYNNYKFIDMVFGYCWFITGGKECVDYEENYYVNKIRRTPDTIKSEIEYMNAKSDAEKTIITLMNCIKDDKSMELRKTVAGYKFSEEELTALFEMFKATDVYNKKSQTGWFAGQFIGALDQIVKRQDISNKFFKKYEDVFERFYTNIKTLKKVKKEARWTTSTLAEYWGNTERNDERFNDMKEYEDNKWKEIMEDEDDLI